MASTGLDFRENDNGDWCSEMEHDDGLCDHLKDVERVDPADVRVGDMVVTRLYVSEVDAHAVYAYVTDEIMLMIPREDIIGRWRSDEPPLASVLYHEASKAKWVRMSIGWLLINSDGKFSDTALTWGQLSDMYEERLIRVA